LDAYDFQNGHVDWIFTGHLQAVTVELDSKLGLTVALNGVPAHHMTFVDDLQRHQLRMLGAAPLAGRMLLPATRPARFQLPAPAA